MKLIENIFRVVGSPLRISYKLYGKHRVNFQGKDKHEKLIKAAKERAGIV